MKRTAIALSLCIQILMTGALFAATPIGSVTAAEGTVTAEGRDGLVRVISLGSPIFVDDKIITGAETRMQIQFEDGSVLRQGEQSEMVINEYVYAPKNRDDNSATLRLFKGVFRVVTDKITKLNPERFSVQTNYGTIGIRGCDLGFDIDSDFEDVTIIALHHADSVVVALNEDVAVTRKEREVVVTDNGVVVRLSETGGLSSKPASPGALETIGVRTLPLPPSTSKVEMPDAETKAEPATKSPASHSGSAASLTGESGAQYRVDTLVSDSVFEEATIAADPAPPMATEEEPVRRTTTTVEPSYPQQGPRTTVASGSGIDWSWDVWSREVTDLVGGDPQTTMTAGRSFSGTRVSATDFNNLASGSIFRSLTGTGAAGAVAGLGNAASTLTGTASLSVRVGMSSIPSWTGIFALSGGGGDLLNFNVAGGITDGSLQSSGVTGYSLQAFGSSYGSPSGQNVSGYLVGPGTGVKPINGAVVGFNFDHGAGGPTVSGAGGADL